MAENSENFTKEIMYKRSIDEFELYRHFVYSVLYYQGLQGRKL